MVDVAEIKDKIVRFGPPTEDVRPTAEECPVRRPSATFLSPKIFPDYKNVAQRPAPGNRTKPDILITIRFY
jgi:hypothetical protein